MFTIVSTRFNNETIRQNRAYIESNGLGGCIYPVPQRLSPHIHINSLVFVVEMNNTTNMVEGVGLIRNAVKTDKYYKVYEDLNFNRYVYQGKYHMYRDEIEPRILEIMETILFRGKTHSKRGSGMTCIPVKLLEKYPETNVSLEMKKMYINKFNLSKKNDI